MAEYTGHLHLHSAYSDGRLYHAEIAAAALRAGLDFVFVTDHNVYVRGIDRYFADGPDRRVLVLAAEEIHHQNRDPQKNHLLVVGTRTELSPLAEDPQKLIDAVRAAGGACFLAHPYDPSSSFIREPSLGWVSWEVEGFHGLEIWNTMSEFKGHLQGTPAALFYSFFPSLEAAGPDTRTMEKWDSLLASGKRIFAVGGSDGHAQIHSLGPLRKTIFPYEYHFRTVNLHVLLDPPLSGDAAADGLRLAAALGAGQSWVGYDLPAPTRGFRFRAEGSDAQAEMGGEIPLRSAPVLRASLPGRASWRIVHAGSGPVCRGNGATAEYRPVEPGAYRFEARRFFRGALRGWIYSNPIFIS